jgi:exopolysaccharide production protein ExoQ
MPRQLAAFICILFILYLFWMDRKKTSGFSSAMWIPLIWMSIAGSRFISHWLNLSPPGGWDPYLEGSSIDRAVFLILIIAGVLTLQRRHLNWDEIFKKNLSIWLYFLFGLISILWSDYPFVALKRWIKTSGVVILDLVILTEDRPYEATGVVLRRLAFLLLPLSVLFIKYYPDLGRAYHMGQPMFTGVAMQKNSLGALCMISGIYFCWNLLFNRREGNEPENRLPIFIYLIFLYMITWLLYMANSATSLVCLVVAICLFLVGQLPAVAREPRRILAVCIACIVLFGIAELAFEAKDTLITMLGRRPNLTDRVPMWNGLLAMSKNPLVGNGWESFWLGERQQIVIERWSMLNAHNGYLELYLNQGLIGLSFLLGWIFLGLRNVSRHLAIDYPAAMLRLSFIVVFLLYNWTETSFYGISTLLMLFLIGTMEVPENTR